MSARPYTSDGDSFGTRTLYANDYVAMNSTYANDYAGTDPHARQDIYGGPTHTPAHGTSFGNSYGNTYDTSYDSTYGNAPYGNAYSYAPPEAYPPPDAYPVEYAYGSPAPYLPSGSYPEAEAYPETGAYPDRDSSPRQTRYDDVDTRPIRRRTEPPGTGRIPIRRGGPPAVRQVSSTPLLLRATVVIGLLAAAGVGVFRAYNGPAPTTANLSITGAATAVSADTGAAGQSSCRVQQNVTSRSKGRFTSVMMINNTGRAAVDGWTLTWTYPGATATTMPRLSDGWNATVSSDINGGQATAVDLSRVIPAGGSTTIGFVGATSGKVPTPANFALNGVTCR